MNVSTILEQALQCKSQEDADSLLDTLREAFGGTGPLSHLGSMNDEAYMEGDKPFIRFELNRLISEHYVTMIRPEIRDDKLAVVVVTNYMRDGAGLSSQSWDVADGFDEEVLDGYAGQEIDELAQRAKELAIADHRLLIERVGVPESAAEEAAQKSW